MKSVFNIVKIIADFKILKQFLLFLLIIYKHKTAVFRDINTRFNSLKS